MQRWLIPCNPSIFDVVNHFKESKEMLWLGTQTTQEGDIAYLYVGKPYSEIKYKCIIDRCNIPFSEILDSEYDVLKVPRKMRKNYLHFRVIKEYENGFFPYDEIVVNGMPSVQSQMRISDQLMEYIKSKDGGEADG